jgi:hypothetical protein
MEAKYFSAKGWTVICPAGASSDAVIQGARSANRKHSQDCEFGLDFAINPRRRPGVVRQNPAP